MDAERELIPEAQPYKTYHSTRKYTRKDGTVAEYRTTKKYVPVNKEQRLTKQKVIDAIREATPEQLARVWDILHPQAQ